MFIYHFHRIIRHRVVWGIFAGGVSVLFLFTGYSYLNHQDKTAVAKVGGKAVTADTFASMEQEIRGLGRNRNTKLAYPEVVTQIWQQVAALQVATELKLGANRDEIRSAVQESIGATEGYDSSVHAGYVAELRKLGLTPARYEQYLARMITLRKVGSVVESAAWATPVEVDDELSGLTDEMTVRTIAVSNRFATIGATEPQIQAYFDSHTNAFRLPKRIAVQYVALPVSNYLANVSVTDEQISEYFDEHGDKLTLTNTTESLRRIEARPQIIPIVKAMAARQTAYTNLANSFLKIASANSNNGFTAAASAFGLAVHHTPLFSPDENPAGIDADKDFRDAAFDLDPTQPEGRYGIVQGDKFVYAITSYTNSPAHMPTLAEVTDRVRPLAVAQARAEAFRDYLATIHKELVEGLRKNPNLDAVAHAKAMNVSTSITFAVSTLYQNAFDDYMTVARAALHLQPGELSDAGLTGADDTALFVYMVTRQRGDPLSSEMLRPKACANIERAHAMGVNASWMEWNLTRRGLSLTPHMISQLASQPEPVSSED